MNLFEINLSVIQALDNSVDQETGEIIDQELYDSIDGLEMAKADKVKNIACWIKNLDAEAEALKAEKQSFADRQKKAENKADSLRRYLTKAISGERYEFPEASVSWRRSEQVIVVDGFLDWAKQCADDVLTYKQPEVNKTKLKQAIKVGGRIPDELAHIEERQNIQIK